MSGRTLSIGLITAALLFALAYATFQFRRSWIRGFFVPGSGGAEPPALASGAGGGLNRAQRVRVVLIDGLDAATARGLPNMNQLCADGLDAEVDVGFPTVSLPVQRVLWSGLTQQQTGILFFLKKLDPPAPGIPGQVPDSVAVAESHPKIIQSLGFARAMPEMTGEPPDWSLKTSWRPWLDLDAPRGFERAALDAMAGPEPLVFVHLLRTDTIAHRAGRDSDAFRWAARWSDEFVGQLIAADRAANGDGARWFVLADHGHRAAGGHGGAEPDIRVVRGCVTGAIPDDLRGRPSPYLHLVDISRALADSLGVELDPRSAGRPLYAALAAPVDHQATLPRPGGGRWAAAIALLALALLATAWAAGGRLLALPWWWPVAYLAILVIELPPSLSTHMIYKADGRIIYHAALPGLALLAVLAPLALRRLAPVRVAVAQLALPLAIAGAGLVLAGSTTGEPPLMPHWTGRTSVFLVLVFTGAVVVGLAVLARLGPFGSGRTRPRGTDRTAA